MISQRTFGFAVLGLALMSASCQRGHDPGLLEKISLLEAELRASEQKIKDLQDEAKQSSDSSTPSAASAPDVSAAQNSYLSFVDTVRKQLTSQLSGWKVERTSVFPVEGPDPSVPIHSRVAFQVSNNGKKGEIVVPIGADASGEWQEPEFSEIIAKFKADAASTTAAQTAPPRQTSPSQPQQNQRPNDVMGSNRTVDVTWGDEEKPQAPAPERQAPPAPAPPQTPAKPQLQKPMPSSRDVIIDFGN